MQEKKIKVAGKRSLDSEEMTETSQKHEKPKKKLKPSETLPSTDAVNGISEKTITKLDTSIFQHFTNLTQEDEDNRLQAAAKLIQQLHRTKDPEKHQKELAYTLKRLIRGCGAASNSSRSGFFTGLVAFLKTFQNEETDISKIFDTMQKELHVGSTVANKEDADAVVGKILVCGALLRSGRILQVNSEHLERITNILLQATHQRSYHKSLSYAFLIEIMETALTEKQFEDAVWPLLHKELTKPWSKQTLQTVHCLMVAQKKFPIVLNAKYFKTHFGGREILNSESYSHLQRIFWAHSDMQIVAHPAFEVFGSYLASCQNLIDFWTTTVDSGIETTTKLSEYLTLKISTDILQNLKPETAGSVLVNLLSPNFMKMLLNGLKQIKIKKDDTLKAFYDEYMEALVACCAKLPETADNQRVAVIQKLILYPGNFGIEKLTSTRIIHQLINSLGFVGVQEIFKIYKQIFCGTLPKQTDEHNKEEWQNFERLNAGYMLQHLLAHKAVQHNKDSHEWRSQQLQFLLICGVFHVQLNENRSSKNTTNDEMSFEPCKKEIACSFSKEFGEQCKNMFYTSLQSKYSDLQQERTLNLYLVKSCDKYMQKGHFSKFIRIKLTEQNGNLLQSAWQKMKSVVTAGDAEESGKKTQKGRSKIKEDNEDKLQLVFHIMLLHMGLQLFREPDMAAPAIDDLIKCMQRTKKQQKSGNKHSSEDNKTTQEKEPDWIEVVIDLFLHLLSQNTGALRSSVNNLFPHLCKNMNVSAIHQILAMLDMKDGQNPLSRKDDDDDDVDELSDEEETADGKESENSDNDEEDSDGDEDTDDDDEDDDDDENGEEDDEDITASDKLRNAISQALIANGAAINSAEGNDDDDMASVDLNDITEEEGRRLDEALAAAFKTMKKTPNSQGSDRKKTKSQRVESTTVMHFRIRVLDLIDIYIHQSEIYLLNHIEIMLALYNMLEYCWSEELKPLQTKVEKVLQNLTTSKNLGTKPTSLSAVHVDDLQAEDLVCYIRQLAEKKTPSVTFDITNSIRNRCIVFLINNASRLTNGNEKVLELCMEYQAEFINIRNPTVNITLLSELYKLRWPCIWKLGIELAEKGLQITTRAFRRIQVCEILCVLYRNNELQKLDPKTTQKHLNELENTLVTYIEALTTSWKTPQARQSHKEFQTLLELLLQAQRTHNRLKSSNPIISSVETCEQVQNLRRHIRLESTHIYQRYCAAFKLSVLRNSDVVTVPPIVNGNKVNIDSETEESKSLTDKNQEQRSKTGNVDKRKQRKQKKLERMLAASKGINGGFGVKRKADTDSSGDENEE